MKDRTSSPTGEPAKAELLNFLEQVARSACLKQEIGNTCICFACVASRLLARFADR